VRVAKAEFVLWHDPNECGEEGETVSVKERGRETVLLCGLGILIVPYIVDD
jgi:hypothetical protein